MSPTDPSLPPRRRADAVRSRERLLAAAADLLGSDPEAPVEAIAARAGVGRTTLFRHFPTRSELVLASWTHLLAHAETALAGLRLEDEPPEAALRALVAELVGLAERWPLLFRGERPAIDDPRLTGASSGPEATVAAAVRRAVDAGVLRDDLPGAVLSELLLGLVQAVLIAGLRGPAAAEAALTLLFDGAGRIRTPSAPHGRARA